MRAWNFGRGKGTTNQLAYAIVCEWCGEKFPAKRPDALTCCNAHRLRWARWRKKVQERGKGTAVVGPRGDVKKQYFFNEQGEPT